MNLIAFVVWVLTLSMTSTLCVGNGPITITTNPDNGVFTTGSPVSITCFYTSSYTFESFVHPIEGDIDRSSGNFHVSQIPSFFRVTLEISSPTRSDAGTYFCKFRLNSNPNTIEHEFIDLEFQEPPVIIDPQLKYEAVVGESITLTCNTNHTTTVVWSRSDDPVNSNSRITSNGGILTFHSVLLTDAGSYRCYAGNELGLVQVDVELVVRERPTVDVRPAILEVNLGDTAAFTCTVGGHPLPSVKWVEVSTGLVVGEENTEQVTVDSSTVEYRLMFNNVSSGDIGSYKCEATNKAGTVEKRVILNLFGSVEAIQNVLLTLLNQTNIVVTWDTPPNPTNVLSYTVTWQSANSDIPQRHVLNGPNPPTSYTITGLERLTRYSVFVFASNDHGRGVDSEQKNITTDAIVPSGLLELSLFDIAPVSTQMEFDLSALDDGGANITTIQLCYTVDGQSWQSYEVSSMDRALLPRLQPNTEYQLRAQPGNRIGFGPQSADITFTTSPAGHPGSPSHVTSLQQDANSILVCWEASQVGGPFLRYLIEGTEVSGETVIRNVSVDDLETTSGCAVGAMVNGLNPDSCYQFSISVTNDQGTGQSSALSSEACTLPLPSPTITLTISPLVNPLSDTGIIAIVVVVAVLFALTLMICVVVCCCCCRRLRRNKTKYNLPETGSKRRASARSDTHLMTYQHQSSSGSVSSDSSPRTASTQVSNPFVFEPSPQPDPQFYYTGSNAIGPSGSNTLGPAYPSPVQHQQQHSTHSLPSYYHPQHSQSPPPVYPPPPSEQSDFQFINNPYYKKFQLQNIPEQEEHINYAYVSVPPPLPSRTYSTDNTSEVAPSEVSSIPVGESYSQPSSSPRLKKKKKHKHSPNHGPLQNHVISEVDGTDFTNNNAYEAIPVPPVVERGPANGRSVNSDMESEQGEPIFEIQSQERGAVFETVKFRL